MSTYKTEKKKNRKIAIVKANFPFPNFEHTYTHTDTHTRIHTSSEISSMAHFHSISTHKTAYFLEKEVISLWVAKTLRILQDIV